MSYSPAIVRTATWDVVAWNRAAASVLTDYGALPPDQRNILRMIFCDPRVRAAQWDWQSVARFVVAAFRIDAARAGADAEVAPLVEELSRSSAEFAAMWRDNNVQTHGDGVKRLRHPRLGPITLEYSAFAVDARPDLSLIVYNPATPADQKLHRVVSRPKLRNDHGMSSIDAEFGRRTSALLRIPDASRTSREVQEPSQQRPSGSH